MKKIPLILLCFIVISCNSDKSSLYDENADYDGDGITNLLEDLNQDGNPDNDDTDGDGTPNYLDPDDDGDGILTSAEDSNGDGYIIIDDEDCDDIPDYLDADRFQALNGVWRLVSAYSKFNNGWNGIWSVGYNLKNDTLTYLRTYGHGTYPDTLRLEKYIYKAKMKIDFPDYQYTNSEFRSLNTNFQKDTVYTKKFGDSIPYAFGVGSYYLSYGSNHYGYFEINDNFFDHMGNTDVFYCAAANFCLKQTVDTLKFDSYTHSHNHSGFKRTFVFVREE